MLSYLLRQLTNSFGIFFRTIRAFFTRKLVGAWSYLRRITNFSRQATKVATTSFQGAATAMKKPSKREDYIETQRLFISKSFLILLAVKLVLIGLLFYFFIWPFLLSHFFVAKFYQGDQRLSDWSGKVIVYYDEEKQSAMYKGTLEDGKLQGNGEEYSEEGLLVYEGNFSNGQRSGEGRLCDDGVLVYEGQFSSGEPNGVGIAYADGVKCYQGAFVDGVYDGEGVTYYPSGARAYVGSFAAGLYEGEGTEYSEDGQAIYKGSFAQGVYEGSGTVYLDDGSQIRAEFTGGVSNGAIQWYRKGKLWYDGSADNLSPDGFGTLYAESGKVAYAGEFDQGTLDGAWLLGLTAGELREAFGQVPLTESDSSGGFSIENQEIGLSALCSYQQEDAGSEVYRLWLAPAQDSAWAALLPWEDTSQAASWAVDGREATPQASVTEGTILQPDGSVSEDWYQRQYIYADYVCTLLSHREDEPPVQICWSREMPEIGQLPQDPQETQAQEQLDGLISALDGMDGSIAAGDEAEDAAVGAVVSKPDQTDVSRLLSRMRNEQDGEALMDALIDYYVYGGMADSLEAGKPLLEQELEKAQSRMQREDGLQEDVDQAQAALDSLDGRIAQYRTAQEKAGLTVEELCKVSAEDYDLSAVLLLFDPETLDTTVLYDAALTHAKANLSEDKRLEKDTVEREIKSAILELGLSYQSVCFARTSVQTAIGQMEKAAESYAKGMADQQTLYAAQYTRDEAAAALYQAAGTFTHQANKLNTLCGGWLAQEYDWMAEAFAGLF